MFCGRRKSPGSASRLSVHARRCTRQEALRERHAERRARLEEEPDKAVAGFRRGRLSSFAERSEHAPETGD
jgi:hypothetical protein